MKKITQEKLKEILDKHQEWLFCADEGERADLSYMDLTSMDLRNENLGGVILKGADLRNADLTGATLVETDLKGADIDCSCLPLWWGSLYAHFDDRQLKQIAYHLVKAGLHSKNASQETKRELEKLIDFANGFHGANECGKITWEEEK